MNSNEYLELKRLLLEQQTFLSLLIPQKMSISRISELSGKSRQAIRQYLLKHYEPEAEFWIEKDKIYVSKEVAVQLITRGAK